MKRQFNEFLKDIIEEINIINDGIGEISFEDFKENKILVRGVTRSLEIIGEAVSNIPDSIKEKYSNISWRNIKDFRNIIVHQYWSIDYSTEWFIIKTKLDILKKNILEIIQKENIK